MAYKFDILHQVKLEIIDAFDWYEKKQLNLGYDFVDEVEITLDDIKKHPKHFQIKHQNKFREATVNRFPYLVIYQIIENTIVILSVFPSKDNPDKKPK